MKRIIKKPDSKIVSDKLIYKKGQTENNKRLREALEEEQDYKILMQDTDNKKYIFLNYNL